MKKFICFLCWLSLSIASVGQSIKIGDWSVHPNHTEVNVVTSANSKVYIGTKSGLFIYDNLDGGLTVFSKLDGLNSFDVTALTYNANNNSLLVGYRDGNIDLIKGGSVVNIPDIKFANILSAKHINNIFVDEELAYISCPFGLVIYNLTRMEVSETCYFNNNGLNSEVYQVCVFNNEMYSEADNFLANKIFVGTSSGLFYANKNDNLLDYSVWKNDGQYSPSKLATDYQEIGETTIKHVVGFDSKSKGGKQLIIGTDFEKNTSYFNDNSNLFAFNFDPLFKNIRAFRPIDVSGDIISINHNTNSKKIVIISYNDVGEIIILNESFEIIGSIDFQKINNTDFELPLSIISGAALDNGNNEKYNQSEQLVLIDLNFGAFLIQNVDDDFIFLELIAPNGPASTNTGTIDSYGNRLLFTHGAKTSSWNNTYNDQEISFFNNQYWETSDTLIGLEVYDAVSGCIAPNNKFFIGTWNNGLLEFENNKLINHYNPQNVDAIQSISGTSGWSRIGGVDIDANQNMWMTNSQTDRPLVKFSLLNKSWSNFSVPGLSTSTMSGKILCASNGYKWIQLRNEGLIVAQENGKNILSKKLGTTNGLSSTSVNCFEEDNGGVIWIGTSQGLSVVYSPSEVFNNSSYVVDYILVETEDGYVERLFENVEILDIKVDGGNRKWIATKNSGVFLVSEDGSDQIYNFKQENSPLLDNTVYEIAIMASSGEVFFATAKGLCSYRSDATQSLVGFQDVIVFPNPVSKNYQGMIAISGLSDKSNVKITDISGNLVFETISSGGTATWDGRRFNGERVKTGVYLFLCTSQDFESSIVKKVLIYN